jgi:aspartyl-tRNA(Asn)/glutamyl-tRNA(Gln) amidotransferase subunit C
MSLAPDDVRHIATLARLTLTEEEIARFTKDLGGIFALIERLGEVDTSAVEPTAQVTGLSNVVRADEVRAGGASPDALLAASPLPVREHQIETPSAHGSH